MSEGWEAVRVADEVHVRPIGDLVTHDSDDCVCGPAVEPVKRDDGGVGWVLTHHSLDARELQEQTERDGGAP